MGPGLSRFLAWSIVPALMTTVPALAEPVGGRGTITVRSAAPARQASILPDDESRLLGMVNRTRELRARLSPLIMDATLRSSARRHSQDMALRGYVGHGSFDGQRFPERLGWTARPWTRAGENVAAAPTVEQGHRALVASPGHLRNILNGAFHRVGIGIATAGGTRISITEEFAE